jgi:hypothetical protein
MFKVIIYKTTYSAPVDEFEDYTPEMKTEAVTEDSVESFQELLDFVDREVHPLASWLSWSSSHPRVNGGGYSDWVLSQTEEDYRTGDRTQYSFHLNPDEGIKLTEEQIEEISTYLFID